MSFIRPKKYNVLSLAFLLAIGTLSLAQNRLNVHFHDETVYRTAISAVDSLSVDQEDSLLNLFRNGNDKHAFSLASVDSLTFSDTLTGIPAIRTLAVDKIVQESARSGISVLSAGTSSILSRGICWSTHPDATVNDSKYTTPLSSSTQYLFLTGLKGSTTYYVRSFATNAVGTNYGENVRFTTTEYVLPTVETVSVTNNGGLEAACVGLSSATGGYAKFLSRGFCWSTKPTPTLADSVAAMPTVLIGSFSKTIKFPSVNVTYYVRAYATNELGTTYGAVMSVKPTMGNLTYTIDTGSLPVGSTNYNLVKAAMDSAMYYYNRYATFSGNIWVYYSSGIPTAQASYRGSIGFGSNTGYMQVCTAMHETAHWLGSGTTGQWQALTVNGVYTGTAATAALREATANSSAVLYGDDMHFWPYGLNYASEVKSANDYVIHAKIVNAMKTDCGW